MWPGMMRSSAFVLSFALLSAASTALGSCAFDQASTPAPERSGAPPAVPVEVAGLADASEAPAVASEETVEEDAAPTAMTEPSIVPRGVFSTVDALCREQQILIVPRLREAEKHLFFRGAEGSTEQGPLLPSCHEAPFALAHAKIALRAPVREVRAIELEAGYATETHLVVRTDDGWRAVQAASNEDEHDDPGCPSIPRDGPIVEVRVEGDAAPVLVVIVRWSRGDGEEEIAPAKDGSIRFSVHSLHFDRARACHLDAEAIACDTPVVLDARRTTWVQGQSAHTAEEQVFTTTYRVDDAGHLLAAQTYVDPILGEP
jgi:hypothetical protein